MWKATASILCLAALPLIGCAGNFATERQVAVTENPTYYDNGGPGIYTAGPAAPTAILVFLPGSGGVAGFGAGEFQTRDAALWAAQGFDVVMPPASDIHRLVANEQAALARLVASAQALADAPIWLVGPSPMIDATLAAVPPSGRGAVSGIVVTSVNSRTGSCRQSVFYSDPGTGAAPTVEVRKSGDCEAGMSPPNGRRPSTLPTPTPRPNAPRIIEASAVPQSLSPAARAHRLAELIKALPPS